MCHFTVCSAPSLDPYKRKLNGGKSKVPTQQRSEILANPTQY